MQKVYDFLKKTGTYYLATVDDDRPRIRPFGTINIFDGKLYIQTGKNKDVAKQIAANPKAEICAYDGETWIRLNCTLVEDGREEAKESMLAAYPFLRARYGESGDNAVFYMTNATAVFYPFGNGGEPETVTF
ncbi:MAG: pyridoxamine 5'-phosphate oxidase family protein [Defluviitaleaceae bacterium]|nr:pyridoxamine 5'-phosphate oxidase family protein [Defluviitaleaceae bacterium]